MKVRLDEPYVASKIAALKVGDIVEVSGHVLTGRDRFHRYLAEGGRPPIPLKDAAIYHCGPVVVREGGVWKVLAAGPTTSTRLNRFLPIILEQHAVRVVIGKGGMDENVSRAFRRHGCVYLHAVGGAAASLAAKVREVADVYFLQEFGPTEAVWNLVLDRLEAVVTMDALGHSLHQRIQGESRRSLAAILG